MSFKKGLISASVALFGVSAVWMGQASAASGADDSEKSRQATKEWRQMEAQSKTKAPAPTPATDQGLSNVDRVNRALNPGPSNPDVPLPHPDLANSTNGRQNARPGPQIFGRQEEGGGVFGLRMPIPADRSATSTGTKSSSH